MGGWAGASETGREEGPRRMSGWVGLDEEAGWDGGTEEGGACCDWSNLGKDQGCGSATAKGLAIITGA